MTRMVLVLITHLFLLLLLTQRIFQIRGLIGIGLRRPIIVAMRGLSVSTTAFLTATVSTILVLFGWCVSDSVFSFCFVA